MLSWMPEEMGEAELKERWLLSDAVRAFESGQIQPDAFAESAIEDFSLNVTPEDFIAAFETWLDGFYEGVPELLETLGKRFRLATLSNTNAIHWPHLMDGMQLGTMIDTHYPSHESGLLKPDADAFENVIAQLNVPASRILFFDDSALNVDAAVQSGLTAHIVDGPASIATYLRQEHLLD